MVWGSGIVWRCVSVVSEKARVEAEKADLARGEADAA